MMGNDCACVSSDPRVCIERRYGTIAEEDDCNLEFCECTCHEDAEAGYDGAAYEWD